VTSATAKAMSAVPSPPQRTGQADLRVFARVTGETGPWMLRLADFESILLEVEPISLDFQPISLRFDAIWADYEPISARF
jgi:hypothetical protein